jgi:hypothetical protein
MDNRETQPGTGVNKPVVSPLSGCSTQLLAGLILFPSIPLFFVSVAALALFYTMPERFGGLLARLPGDQFIRSALTFAPATLFALVVLALLYVVERPQSRTSGADDGLEPAEATERVVERGLASGRHFLLVTARLGLIGGLLLLVFSVSLLAVSFVAPGRFGLWMDAIPGGGYLRSVVRVGPFLLFAGVVIAGLVLLLLGERRTVSRPGTGATVAQFAAGAALLLAIPLLLASLGAFALYYLSPARFEALLLTISMDNLIRLSLIFAPAVLFSIVVLAGLVLFTGSVAQRPSANVRTGDSVVFLSFGAGLFTALIIAIGFLGAVFLLLRWG